MLCYVIWLWPCYVMLCNLTLTLFCYIIWPWPCCVVGTNDLYWTVDGEGHINADSTSRPGTPFYFQLVGQSRLIIKAPNGKYMKGEQNGIFSAKAEHEKATKWEYWESTERQRLQGHDKVTAWEYTIIQKDAEYYNITPWECTKNKKIERNLKAALNGIHTKNIL